MINQDKREYLERYLAADQKLDHLYEELEHWRSRATRTTSTFSLCPARSHESGSQVETAMEKIIFLEGQINAEIDHVLEIKQQVVDAIKTVPDQMQQVLLSRRYILGETWEHIAAEMHYGYQWVCKLHGKALAQMDVKEAIESDTQSMVQLN